jgi:DUF971 family protein
VIKPKAIQQFPSGELGIIWEDGHESVYPPEHLRENCPCALCSGSPQPKKPEVHPRQLKVITVHPGRFTIDRLSQVGHYAINLRWADGHDTGIYTFDYLRKLCPCDLCKK